MKTVFNVTCKVTKKHCSYVGTIMEKDVNEIIFEPKNYETNESSYTIEEFHIKSNNIYAIPPSIFKSFSQMRSLKIQKHMENLEPGIFQHATFLTYLDLDCNKLTVLKHGVFKGAENLVEIHLTKNCLSYIDIGTFENLNSLRVLDLSWNQIAFIHAEAFRPLTSLMRLYLFSNPLMVLNETQFATNLLLEDLHLQPCNLTALHENTFSHLVHLRNLFLRNNICINKEYIAYRFAKNRHPEIKRDLKNCTQHYELYKEGKANELNEKIAYGISEKTCSSCFVPAPVTDLKDLFLY